jgi:hypothetical protein
VDWATREWTWFAQTGMITKDHLVIDGLDLTTCGPGWNATFTYNQGVILGGLVDLWRSTPDAALLDTADQIAHAVLANMTDANGVLVEGAADPACGGGDGTMFKGPLVRNVAYLHEARPRPEYQAFLLEQSDSLWKNNRDAANQFGQHWPGPFDCADSSRQGAALDALNAAVRANNMNLALGRASTSSAPCSPDEGPDRATDGSSSWDSKWCSGGMSGQFLQVDLGATRYIVGFRVRHAGAGGEDSGWNTRDFELQTSSDGTTWLTQATVTNNTADVTTHPIVGVGARYVRLHVTTAQTRTDAAAARIYELEVFGVGL